MNQALLHRINALEEQFDDEHQERELLSQCAASGQMDEHQLHAHRQAGELPSCCQHHGFEEGGCNGRNCPAGRFEMPTPNLMLLATGLAAIASILVMAGVLVYLLAPFVWPVVRPFFTAFFN